MDPLWFKLLQSYNSVPFGLLKAHLMNDHQARFVFEMHDWYLEFDDEQRAAAWALTWS